VLATPTRRGRRAAPVVCGRRHCIGCRRWRHVCDYTVDRWADLARTEPRTFRPKCRTCANQTNKRRYHDKPLEVRAAPYRERRRRLRGSRPPRYRPKVEPLPPPSTPELERLHVEQFLARMTKENRLQFELEGALPFSVMSIAVEDYDPTPVPTGCPSCYLHGGVPCESCPDADVKAKARIARKEGRVIGNPLVIAPIRSS
jgi:hypothetical protein